MDYVRGIKAGIMAGLVSAIFFVGSNIAIHLFSGDSIGPSTRFYVVTTEETFTWSVILGTIVGLIFTAIHNKIMKNTPLEIKGLITGTILWLLSYEPWQLANLRFGSFYILFLVIGLAGYLIFGFLLGNFYKRFGPKTTTPQLPDSGLIRQLSCQEK